MAVTLEELEIIVNRVVRHGVVVGVNPSSCSVSVDVPDGVGGTETLTVPVMVKQAFTNKDYWIPEAGEKVVCVFYPPECTSGACLGGVYESSSPPASSADVRMVKFNDSTEIKYDRRDNSLSIHCAGPVNVSGEKIMIKTVAT